MEILRLKVPSQILDDSEDPTKVNRLKKRIQALNTGLPKGQRAIYYAATYQAHAEAFARSLGNVRLLPMDQYGLNADETLRIMMESPKKMAASLCSQTGVAIDFHQSMAVLTRVEGDGQEVYQWALSAKEWIYLAYPEEMRVPARRGSGLTLQQILLPQIEIGAHQMRKNLKHLLEAPEEVESVHQYRVAIRAIRALISFVKPLLPSSAYAQLQSLFRQLGQEGALLRELDVLIDEALRQGMALEGPLLTAMISKRRAEADRLVSKLSDSQIEWTMHHGINHLLHLLTFTSWHKLDGITYLDHRLNDWYAYTLESLWKRKTFELGPMHRVRLKTKKYRYISEFFKDHLTQTQVALYKRAKKRQSLLGEVCDALRNQEALEALLDSLPPSAYDQAQTFIHSQAQRVDDLIAGLGWPGKKPIGMPSEKETVTGKEEDGGSESDKASPTNEGDLKNTEAADYLEHPKDANHSEKPDYSKNQEHSKAPETPGNEDNMKSQELPEGSECPKNVEKLKSLQDNTTKVILVKDSKANCEESSVTIITPSNPVPRRRPRISPMSSLISNPLWLGVILVVFLVVLLYLLWS